MPIKYVGPKTVAVTEGSFAELATTRGEYWHYVLPDGPAISEVDDGDCVGAFITDKYGNIVPFEIIGNVFIFTDRMLPADQQMDHIYNASIPAENTLVLITIDVTSGDSDTVLYYRRAGTDGRLPVCRVAPSNKYATVHMVMPSEFELFTEQPEEIYELEISVSIRGYILNVSS